jgi:hypothetical protein
MSLLWIEIGVVLVITAAFVLSTLLFKPEHVEHHPARVRKGAAIQGLIIGLMIGFLILPLRVAFFVPDAGLIADAPPAPRGGMISLSFLPIIAMLIVVRRGLLARAPFIGKYLRAYRKAMLKWQIDGAQKVLIRLEALDERRGTA